MHQFIRSVLFASLAATAFAAPEVYTIDPSHTLPSFEVNHLGYSTQRGSFDKSSGTITLDLAAKTGATNIIIDTTSLRSGWEKRDAHLKGEDFFNTEKFPTMTFKSNDFKFAGDKLVSVVGELTLLGVSKPVTLKVTNFKCSPHPMSKKPACGADASTTIKRSDFGMSAYVPAVSDEVTLRIQVEASK
ncbi:YceI family protein [uncultured Deefgea sp.]|uniref:YceI family protein n=1 Tax=uncultured Deefgea sp. TaxID=1304914 RepID=UPI00263671F7|nr:YceI family protein [uncultured Deefgea sp.]